MAGNLSDSDSDYTSARIRQELTNALLEQFGGRIISARCGHWLKFVDTATTAGRTRYRLPYRATAIESIQLVDSSGNDQGAGSYEIQGDQVVFRNAPTAGLAVRVFYYLRPSTLQQEQTTLVGKVTAVDVNALTVVVASVPIVDRVTGTNVLSGDKIDIVHPNGWHELAVVNVAATLSSSTFTFPAGTDLSDVELGDYVRAADQTDWPAIQDEFHATLARVTAAQILNDSGKDKVKAKLLMEAAEGTDSVPGPLKRFSDLIEPRVKDSSKVIVPRFSVLRGQVRVWPVPRL